jgi:hypothetical protein
MFQVILAASWEGCGESGKLSSLQEPARLLPKPVSHDLFHLMAYLL